MTTAAERWDAAERRLKLAKEEFDAALKEHGEAREELLGVLRGGAKFRARLTAREDQVLLLVQQKLSNKEIAAALNIVERTVKFHVSSLLAKYGVDGRQKLLD